MLNELLLQSGNDIPFTEAKLTIHQPTIKEIAYIGEEAFFLGSEMLNFSKDSLNAEDKTNLEKMTNFEVFMSIMKDKKTIAIQKNRISALLVLSLIFPGYKPIIGDKQLILIKEDNQDDVHIINADNYEKFKEILKQMFCMKRGGSEEYNPGGTQAARIAEKLKQGRQKAATARNQNDEKKIAVFSRYISILAVGENKTQNELLQYTVYQLFDEFERFEAKNAYDLYLQAKLAGAKDLKEVESWMRDLHE